MRYKPQNNTTIELLEKCGFSPCETSRGYELGKYNHRLHAFVEDDELNFHYDMAKKGKTHQASSFGIRARHMKEIFEYIDGIKDKVHSKNRYINIINPKE